jgi:hypothetical protein
MCTVFIALKYAFELLNRLLWIHAENIASLVLCCLCVSEVRVGYLEVGRTCTVGNVNNDGLKNVILEAGPYIWRMIVGVYNLP